MERALKKLPKVQGGSGQVYLAPETARLLDSAEQIAKKAGDSFVTAEYLLLALALASGTTLGRDPDDGRRHAAGAERRHRRPAQGPHRRQRHGRERL